MNASPLLLCLALTAPALPAAPSTLAEDPDLKSVIDQSIRWLRTRQDAEHGGYGSGTLDTAWVLRAMAASPRRYRAADGPFVARGIEFLLAQQAEDGSIADEGAEDDARLEQTRVSTAALALLVEPPTQDALGRALAWLAEKGVDRPADLEGESIPREAEAARGMAEQLLAGRGPDGRWEDEDGKLIATSRAILKLTRLRAVLHPQALEGAESGVKPLPKFDQADRAASFESIGRGARFLMEVAEQGKWGAPGRPDAGLTAMVISALQAVPEPRPQDIQSTIDQGLEWIASFQQEDGSIHQGQLANYVTSAAILALARSGNEQYRPVIEKARDYLITLQADGGEGYSPDHHYYGGIGYGGDERPDLSNLQMALEALAASGLERDHEAWSKALGFLQRCQNRSESNDAQLTVEGDVIVAGDDGGASYMPGDSPAGFVTLADGKKMPRSYGSMSYALLKGFALAGLPKDDPRMLACFDWLQKNYTLDVNPGFEAAADPSEAYQGLFYYFHVMAQALDLYDVDVMVDAAGKSHAWRKQLSGRLIAMQNPVDGSWVNENAARWWEGNPVLATSYVLLTLDAAQP